MTATELDFVNNVVTMPMAKYNSLINQEKFLIALENAGVDNWDGYDFAREEMGDD